MEKNWHLAMPKVKELRLSTWILVRSNLEENTFTTIKSGGYLQREEKEKTWYIFKE